MNLEITWRGERGFSWGTFPAFAWIDGLRAKICNRNLPNTKLENQPMDSNFRWFSSSKWNLPLMEQSPSWGASREIRHHLWNPKVCYFCHKRPPLVSIVRKMNVSLGSATVHMLGNIWGGFHILLFARSLTRCQYVPGRSCDRPSRHRFCRFSSGITQMAENFPSCYCLLLMQSYQLKYFQN
jgi:hypothetical protein